MSNTAMFLAAAIPAGAIALANYLLLGGVSLQALIGMNFPF
ncbi:MAG: hypothetical protein WC702_03870 [Patescibacteria group bacterium]|jgi:hypothetical protein